MSKKTKQILSLLMSLIMAMSMFAGINVSSFAADDILSYLTWRISNHEVTITDCDELISGDIVIPDMIEGYPVTEIGISAFYDCDSITSIVIPNSVTTFDRIPFGDCDNLESITFNKNNPNYSIDEYGVLYNKDKTVLMQFLGGNDESIIISDSVKTISEGAFNWCDGFSSIVVPGSVETIEAGAFQKCGWASDNLNITIQDGVTSIGLAAFALTPITNITIPESVTNFEMGMFSRCYYLESVLLPNNISVIDMATFDRCFNLKNVNLPDNLTTINESAFEECMSLESISLPASLTEIGKNAFLSCNSMKDIYIYNPDLIIGKQSLGYKSRELTVDIDTFLNDYYFGLDYSDVTITYDEPVLIDDVTIHGYKGSTAEAYAKENGIAFEALDAECSHDNTELINIVEPDCKNNGYTGDVYCKDCEEIISYGETVPATDHNYLENIIKEPTFTQPGLKNDICENCGDATAEEEIPQLTIEDSEEKENADTDISIIYPDGTFDGEIEVEVTPVEEGEAYKLISHKEGNYKVTMFDINVTVDGENVQPGGTVLVKIPLPNGYNPNKFEVYYVADDGTMEELTTYHYKDGYVYFETDHFSYYAILEEEAETTEEKSFFTMIKEFFERIVDFFKQIFESLKNLFA